MLTSRNGLTEPLNRLFTPNLAYTVDRARARSPSADLFIPGELFKMAQLVMPITDPMGTTCRSRAATT